MTTPGTIFLLLFVIAIIDSFVVGNINEQRDIPCSEDLTF